MALKAVVNKGHRPKNCGIFIYQIFPGTKNVMTFKTFSDRVLLEMTKGQNSNDVLVFCSDFLSGNIVIQVIAKMFLINQIPGLF